jgi:hypothetical protein
MGSTGSSGTPTTIAGEQAVTERRALFRPRQAVLWRTSAGNQPVAMAETRTTACRAAGMRAETAVGEVVRAPGGSPRVHKPCHRDDRRGHMGKTNGWCVVRHRGGRRLALT